jgi:hypothetical protein
LSKGRAKSIDSFLRWTSLGYRFRIISNKARTASLLTAQLDDSPNPISGGYANALRKNLLPNNPLLRYCAIPR